MNESKFYLHNGYLGWAYGTPHNPMLISEEDGMLILDYLKRKEGKDFIEECKKTFPPVEYAIEGSEEYIATRQNRFIFYGDVNECVAEKKSLIKKEFSIDRKTFEPSNS